VFLFLTVATVWTRLSVVKTTYDITQVEKTLRSLRQDREQIEIRVAGLRSPRRLEALAKSKFGLAQPRSDQIIFMENDSK